MPLRSRLRVPCQIARKDQRPVGMISFGCVHAKIKHHVYLKNKHAVYKRCVYLSEDRVMGKEMHETFRRLYEAARQVRPAISTVADLARALNQSEQTINNWAYRGNGVSKQGRLIAQRELGINATWIDDGQGQMVAGSDPGNANVRPADMGLRRIPLISSVQAGQMTEAITPFPPGAAFEYLLTDLKLSEQAFALEIEGQSMEPEFKEGDRIIIDPAVRPQPGDFVVAKNGCEEATFKKYRPRGIGQDGREVFELVPLNVDYPTISSVNEPARIIGVMVEHRRYRRR
ncbi:LexA family protein [Pandoraea aquatica]|nr:S24 family peptidase [Pandoraea aquatica]